jgi:SAM-dependent methyltransferase
MSQQPRQYVGAENLELMENAIRYTSYVGRIVADELPSAGRIVEFGAGSGTQTSHVVSPNERVTCIEINPDLQAVLRSKGYQATGSLDDIPVGSASAFYSINCLEHIEDDGAALREIHQRLADGGSLVLYVPAMPVLFSSMDKLVGHYRRYRRRELVALLAGAGFTVTKARYVDSVGVLPSLIYKMIPTASGEPSPKSLKFYDNYLFPVSLVVDKVTAKLFGKNVFVVAVKK